MKKLTVLLVVFASLLTFITQINSKKSPFKLVSPLLKEENVLGINQWLPGIVDPQANAPEISAKAALFVDTKSGEVLYSKNVHDRLPIASLVKVMTALVALEHKGMDDQFTISQKAADMEPDKMLLIAGEKLTLRELLDGIFLVSGNDAAETLAEGTLGSREEFIKLMNDKAVQLGMKDTLYVNPTGLDEDSGSSFSTVYDLAILARYLIRHFPEVVDISEQTHIYLPVTPTHQDYDMYSGINLLATYPGVVGFKTGYTPEAGVNLNYFSQKRRT